MDVYRDLDITTIINAAGTLTTVGGSLMPEEVLAAMQGAARHYVDMEELHRAAGERIAALVGAPSAHVTSCASAGITVMAAACMTGTDRRLIDRLPDSRGMRNEFVVQRAHRNGFDTAVQVAGGNLIAVGPSESEISDACNQQTAAVYYTLAWFCREEALSLSKTASVAHQAGVPLIVDAAAEVPPVENLARFLDEGADLVAFSGGKAIRGPQASGFILGREELIEACRLNDCPNMGIARGMKAGKEEIVGLVKAVELYVRKNHAAEMEVWHARLSHIQQHLKAIEQVEIARRFPYGVGQQIPHLAVRWNEAKLGVTLEQAVDRLADGVPRIAVQLLNPRNEEYHSSEPPHIRVHPHTLADGQERIVADRLVEVLKKHWESGS